jgi:SAM-dependent methyltransferase
MEVSLCPRKQKGIVGVDISDEALAHARHNFGEENITFIHGDEYLYTSEFDTVISFETIEYMDENAGDAFLQKIKKSLKPHGILIISTPINKTDNKINVTEFHIREYADNEFPRKLEDNGFEITDMHGQGSPFHEKLYGIDGSRGLFRYMKLEFHQILPQSVRNVMKAILMGSPNDGLMISKENWRSAMIQIAVCKLA